MIVSEIVERNMEYVPSAFSPSLFFNCSTYSNYWIAFSWASNSFFLLKSTAVSLICFWYIHNLTKILLYNLHLVLLIAFLFLCIVYIRINGLVIKVFSIEVDVIVFLYNFFTFCYVRLFPERWEITCTCAHVYLEQSRQAKNCLPNKQKITRLDNFYFLLVQLMKKKKEIVN